MTPHDPARAWLAFSPAVEAARADGRPLVALESTLIAHGLPYPDNLQAARAVEAAVRAQGAEPATVAVLGGRIRIGLADAELQTLAASGRAVKASRRDLPAVLTTPGAIGATTVAATMACAALAGIEVFVTGGIGGVHRGAERSFDVSADLLELARTPVAVVCAGAKSILDLPLTLEVLETHGVPVLACDQDAFAAFYVRDSGLPAGHRLDDAAAQARFLRAHWGLGAATGVVLSVPVPASHALAAEEVDAWVRQALQEADAQGVAGKAVTPFLLARLHAASGGRTREANVALVVRNAEVGGRLAVALAALPARG